MTTKFYQRDKTHLYCIRAGKYCKIGITNNINGRLSMINTCNPSKVELVGLATYDNRWIARKSEKAIHKFLKDKRVKGEWFLLSNEDIYISFGEY